MVAWCDGQSKVLAVDEKDWILTMVRQYQAALLVYANRLLGNSDRAQDVVQETFLRLCRQKRSQVEAKLPAWLYTVCRNQVRDLVRKEHRMSIADHATLDARPSAMAEPVEYVAHRESQRQLQTTLQTLPDRDQEVVRLKFQHGLSYQQISEVTGLSVGNVGYILHHALLKLRQLVETTAPRTAPPLA